MASQYSSLAWLIWTKVTGGADDSEPTLSEVQRRVDMVAQEANQFNYWEQFKQELDRNPHAELIVPFMELPLSNATSASEKYLELPADNILSMAKDRGINLVTYGEPEQKIQITNKNLLLSWGPDYRAFQGEYFCYRMNNRLFVQGISTEERPDINKINLYAACAGGTTIPKLLEASIYMRVLADMNRPVLADNNPDQRPAQNLT